MFTSSRMAFIRIRLNENVVFEKSVFHDSGFLNYIFEYFSLLFVEHELDTIRLVSKKNQINNVRFSRYIRDALLFCNQKKKKKKKKDRNSEYVRAIRSTGVGWQLKVHKRRPSSRCAERAGVIGGALLSVASSNLPSPHPRATAILCEKDEKSNAYLPPFSF